MKGLVTDITTHPPIDMNHQVFLIDLMEQNQPYRSGAYVILDEDVTVIETGSSLSHHHLVSGLESLGIQSEDVKYIIVTHVHLDHAGGAGHLMQWAKKAQLIVHPRGKRHMVDPSRLWSGAKGVYGDKITELFGSMIPVPEHRIRVMEHCDELPIGERTLTFFDSPGHAKHHFTILDSQSRALYAGDAVGIRYRTGFTGWDFEWVMPSSSPIDFDPRAVCQTMKMLEKVDFDWVYHTHFGKSPRLQAMQETERIALEFERLIAGLYSPDWTLEGVIEALRDFIRKDLSRQGHNVPEHIEVLDIDVILDAMGLMYYESNRKTE